MDSTTLSEQLSHKIEFATEVRGKHRQWLKMATNNADHALQSHLAGKAEFLSTNGSSTTRFEFGEFTTTHRVFDDEVVGGEATVASCVVFDIEGPLKKDYRRFNIEGVTQGDDYAALRQALVRRYTRLKEGEGILPDICHLMVGKVSFTRLRKFWKNCRSAELSDCHRQRPITKARIGKALYFWSRYTFSFKT